MLTVVEAARVFRIGRTLGYQLASRYLAGEPDGIPVVRLGGCLRVPRSALDGLMRLGGPVAPAELEARVAAAVDRLLATDVPETTAPSLPSRRIARRGSVQLSLLEGT